MLWGCPLECPRKTQVYTNCSHKKQRKWTWVLLSLETRTGQISRGCISAKLRYSYGNNLRDVVFRIQEATKMPPLMSEDFPDFFCFIFASKVGNLPTLQPLRFIYLELLMYLKKNFLRVQVFEYSLQSFTWKKMELSSAIKIFFYLTYNFRLISRKPFYSGNQLNPLDTLSYVCLLQVASQIYVHNVVLFI